MLTIKKKKRKKTVQKEKKKNFLHYNTVLLSVGAQAIKSASCPWENKAKNSRTEVGVLFTYHYTLKHKDVKGVIGRLHHLEKYILMSY